MKVYEFEMSIPNSQIDNVIYEVSKYVQQLDGIVTYSKCRNHIYFKIKVDNRHQKEIDYLIKQLQDHINTYNASIDDFVKDANKCLNLWYWVFIGFLLIIIINQCCQ